MTDQSDRDVLSVEAATADGGETRHSGQTQSAQTQSEQTQSGRPIAPQQGGSFLEGFLAAQNTESADGDSDGDGNGADDDASATHHGPAESPADLEARAIDVLRTIFDPEIPVNIYDLGLIYGVDVSDDMHVTVTMTLTSPHCPVAEIMPGEVETKTGAIAGASGSEVKLVWDPPWDFTKMTDEARLELGLL